MKPTNPLDQAPRSFSGVFGAVGFLAAIALTWSRPLGTSWRVLLCCGGAALPMILHDLIWLKVHRRPTAGLDAAPEQRSYSLRRVLLKVVGLGATGLIIAAGYGLFREYHGKFYDPFWSLLQLVALPFAVATVPYIAWVDARMRQPRDGYWQLGALLIGPMLGVSRADVDRNELTKHARAWLVKAFFLPLMVVYLGQNLDSIAGRVARFDGFASFISFFDVAWLGLYTVDVGFATVGYAMTFRLLDAHTRSAEPTMIGWALCLVCYQPFWSLWERMYLHYDDGHNWGSWLSGIPVLHDVWGGAIIGLTAIYVWATITFGLRFSNLTHRGVLTFGPYRWLRHPAYVSKNLSWWLVTIPFIPTSGWLELARACTALLMVNAIYSLRAWTEERHLGADPAYRAYQMVTPWWGARLRAWLKPDGAK